MRGVLILLLAFSLVAVALSYPSNVPNNYAANPPNYNNCHTCHSSYAVNSGSGSLEISGIPVTGYVTGTTYNLSLDISHNGQRRWGFQLTVEYNSSGQWVQGGQLVATDLINTTLSTGTGDNPDFLKHTNTGTYNGQYNSASWEFDWEAPISGETVTFYVSGLAANGIGGSSGDYVYTTSVPVPAQTTIPEATISLISYGTPIQIPAGGGIFEYNIAVNNSESYPVTMDIWTMVTLPGGGSYGPIINVNDFTIQPGATVNRDRSQNVPASAPAGSYSYHAYIGIYPNIIWDEDFFDFEKLGSLDEGSKPVTIEPGDTK